MSPPRNGYRIVLATADRHEDAERLRSEVLEQMGRSGGTRATIDITRDTAVLDPEPSPADPTTVLVVLGNSEQTGGHVGIAQALVRCRSTFRACLPIWDPRAGTPFHVQIPKAGHALNGLEWRTGAKPGETAGTILRLVGLAESDRRVFLSYARSDGSTLAHQLRYALLDAGWEVFLDQFSIPPAVAFQDRLLQELSDKAFVLLLETRAALGRPYVDQEVAFALNRRLGLLALTAPDAPEDRRFPSVQDDFRHQLKDNDLHGASPRQRLRTRALDAVLREMDERHAAAYQQRREELIQATAREMSRTGLTVVPSGHWSLLGRNGVRDEIALVTARAPEAPDLLELDQLVRQQSRSGRSCRGWLVHPLGDINRDRAALLRWLSLRRRVKPTPVMELARRLAG